MVDLPAAQPPEPAASVGAEEQLRALFDQAPDGIFVADLTGHYTDVNQAGCAMLGFMRDEIVGKSIVDLIPPEDVERLWRDREQFLQGIVKVEEWRLRRKDGSLLPVEVSAKILPDGRWQGLVRDISERKRLEEALARTRSDLERAQKVARTGSWRLDLTRNELAWTDETYRIFGLPLGQPMTYETFLACVHPEDRAVVDAAWTAAMHGAPYDLEHRIVVDGTERWVHERAELEFDPDGRPLGGIGTVQDVTSRKLAERRIANSEARFRAIVDLSTNAIVTADLDHRIVMVNRAAEQMFGWTAAELIGQSLDVLIPPDLRHKHNEHMRAFAEEGTPSLRMGDHRRIYGLRRSGEVFPAEGGVLQAELGGTRLLSAIVSDVSEQARALEDQEFLAQVGALLATSLDPDVTLTRIGELAVRTMADLCVLDVVQEGKVRRLRVVVRDPERQSLATRLEEVVLDRSRPHLLHRVLQTHEPQLMPQVRPEDLTALAQGPEHLAILREMAPRSLLGLPLVTRDHLLGALMLVSTSRRFDEHDLWLGTELATRAAMAIDNAQLLRSVQQANQELRETVAHLQAAQQTIETLTGLLPVCAWCGKIRDDEAPAQATGEHAEEWKPLEQFLADRSTTRVTHAICPICAARMLAEDGPAAS